MTLSAKTLSGQAWHLSRFAVAWLGARYSLLLNAIASFLWVALGVRAIAFLDTSWDSLAYHLPFASRWAGIFPKSGYLFYDHLEYLFQGGPKLGEFLQGMLWRLTGRVSGANLLGLLCILLLVAIVSRQIRVPFWLVTLFFLSIPLVLIHTVTSYTDLPANALLSIAFVNVIAALNREQFGNKNLFFVLLPLALAANIKLQAMEVAIPFWLAVFVIFLYQNRAVLKQRADPNRFKYLRRFLAVNLICALLLGLNYLVNIVRFQNPFYPLEVNVGGLTLEGPYPGAITIKGPLSIQRENFKQGSGTSFSRYLDSLSEVNLWTDNRGRLWSVDMGVVWNRDSPSFKTGGFFSANLALWGSFLAVSLLYTRDRKSISAFLLVLGSFLLVGLLPASIFLRYWLFLPLDLAILTLWISRRNPEHLRPVFGLLIALQLLIFAFVLYQNKNLVPGRNTIAQLGQGVVNLKGISQKYHINEAAASRVCVVSRDTRMGFFYKISNPELDIESAEADWQCDVGTAFYPP